MARRMVFPWVVAAVLLAWSVPARAQGCIMCYESALAASKGVQDALRSGVLVLLVPVALLLVSLGVLVWRSSMVPSGRSAKQIPAD